MATLPPMHFKVFKSYPDESRVWIYQADRNLTDDEALRITGQLQEFATQWTAHIINNYKKYDNGNKWQNAAYKKP